MLNANPTNISQLLRDSLCPWQQPDEHLNIVNAMKILQQYLDLRILDQDGVETLAVYDKFNGFWDDSKVTISRLIRIIRPGSGDRFIHNLIETIISKLALQERTIKSYSGSQYILFNNGFLDLKTNNFEKISSADAFVFTRRHRLNVNYMDKPTLPVINDNGNKWNPQIFINHYTHSDKARERMFLFTLSLGLFGNHHFGVNVNYKGQSGSGKTLLSEIFNNLYGSNYVANITSADLSEKFALGNYNSNMTVIWASENNDSSNDRNIIKNYDSLTDSNNHFQKKGEKDIVFSIPPQLYVEGTSFIKEFEKSPVGIFRRTLCYAFPSFSQKDLNNLSVPGIKAYLKRPRVLEWLVYKMLEAYRYMVPSKKIADYSFDAGEKDLTIMFPSEYADWRKEILNQDSKFDDEIDDFIDSSLLPYIDFNQTKLEKLPKMHPNILYAMFKQFYNLNHGIGRSKVDDINDKIDIKNFMIIFKNIMYKRGFKCLKIGPNENGSKHREKVASANKMNFKINEYIHDNGDRNNIFDPKNPDSAFGGKVINWFVIVPNDNGGSKIMDTKNHVSNNDTHKAKDNNSKEPKHNNKNKPKNGNREFDYSGLPEDYDKFE